MAQVVSDPVMLRVPADRKGKSRRRVGIFTLTLGSLGVVYGDIGTSPIYAFREAVHAAVGQGAVTHRAILGVLSLILWALIIVVTLKYVVVLLRADNNGEGGTLALMALAQKAIGHERAFIVIVFGAAGAALFYGNAILTPAISVLSAVEGLRLATPVFEPYVIPITVLILIALFAVQSHGTEIVAALFGPITVVWFVVIAAAGAAHIATNPVVLAAFNPAFAISFLADHSTIGFVTLGAVFLAVTGAEALYADLGHFGRRPIQIAWGGLVLPSLVLNYLGQGALVLADPVAVDNPFYRLYPTWALYPVIGLATGATIIASQAVITGAYSLTSQAVQLGLLPRLEVRHTSEDQAGQIYMPQINALLLIGVLVLVLAFKTSSALAAAYGIAVTGTMLATALLALVVMWKVWKWPVWKVAAVMVPLILIDVVFLAANLGKVADGGWVSLLVAAGLFSVMLIWRRGTRLLLDTTRAAAVPLTDLIGRLEKATLHRAPGTAVFLTSNPKLAPSALLDSVKHYKTLHQQIVILSLFTANEPRLADEERVKMKRLSPDFVRVHVDFGFMETPNVPRAMALCMMHGLEFDFRDTSYFVSRRTLRSTSSGMPLWQDRMFIMLMHTASDATEYYRIPRDCVVEIGAQVAI